MLSILCLFAFSFAFSVKPKGKKGRAVVQKTDTRVYLQHADELKYDVYGDHPDAQFVRGNVSFMHKGMHLTCDSAYYYENTNSFDAYGHVKMRQGDTLTLVSDKAYYDGNDEMAHAWNNVVLTHRNSKLYCDTLDYDRMYGIADAYGSNRIKLTNKTDVLVADWGRHFTDDDHSEFFYNVVLTNDKGLRIETDTLYHYNKTSMAHAVGPSVITQKDSKVNSTDCWYNTKTEKSELYGRSTVYNGAKEITADRPFNDDKTGKRLFH
jgi:lipopolysaccharide assembly outer membrane protein LptD (OstA)